MIFCIPVTIKNLKKLPKMKIYCYKELRSKSLNELLDMLSSYMGMKNDVEGLINHDPQKKKFYIDNNLYYYELNIRKIKNELEVRV